MTFISHYEPHLRWAEELTVDVKKHAPSPGPSGDQFRADLAGLLTIAYTASFENCVKAIFVSFARSKHKLLGNVSSYHFAHINSKIHWDAIANKYAGQFGETYKDRFMKLLNEEESKFMEVDRISVKQTYANLLKWRHAFAHEGRKLTTIEEVTEAFPVARRVIDVLNSAMSN